MNRSAREGKSVKRFERILSYIKNYLYKNYLYMLTMHFNTKTSNNEVASHMLCFVKLAKRANRPT